MTLVKTDRPRRIDQFIDYFGEPRHGATNDPGSRADRFNGLLLLTEHFEVVWNEARAV